MTFPYKLKKGDIIGIVAPSDGVSEQVAQQFNDGIGKIKSLGFGVKLGSFIYAAEGRLAGNGQEKARDINGFFADKNIKAVICAQGGDSAETALPYLDFELIGRNPKFFIGFSDISVLLNAITVKTGLITYLGPDVVWKFSALSEYDERSFIGTVSEGKNEVMKNSEWEMLNQSGTKKFEGRLWGGNARCFMKLLNTEFFPALDGGILLFEEVNKNSKWFVDLFRTWTDLDLFKKLNGIVLGYNHKCDKGLEKTLMDAVSPSDLNLLKINEFGHKSSHAMFAIGSNCKYEPAGEKLVFGR